MMIRNYSKMYHVNVFFFFFVFFFLASFNVDGPVNARYALTSQK